MTRTARAASPHSLRRRLVWTAIALVLTITASLAVVSALALNSSVLEQLDAQLDLASERAARAPAFPQERDDGQDQPSQVPSSEGTGGPPGGSNLPPGQAAGTIGVFYADGEVVDAGYVDDSGTFQTLTPDQLDALESLPRDDRIHAVELPGLGTFHAVATTTTHGEPVITAMGTGDADATVRSYVLLEVALALAGVAVAAVAGSFLVRRALAPLDHVAAAATRVSELPLDRGAVLAIPRVEPGLTDDRTEVGQVGSAFNRMIDHVEDALSARHDSEMQVRRFVADASHELRTPLASIRGYSELVRRSPEEVPAATMRAMGRIESEAIRMTALVEDLLLLARLDAGRPLERERVDMTALLVDAVADAHAAGPGHRWRLDLPGTAELTVVGDEARLRQVLTNLLGNARVHTPDGTRVTVAARAEAGEVVLHVQDEGPGIPAELRPALFQRFSRADTARTSTGGSTGLGLAIAQAIVHAHGGSITVESRTEQDPGDAATSSRFTVRLPAAQ
ncbi:MAG TPA: HAMP domain-containing sensor histidine kinase [Jiangellaceae bacterium]